MKKIKYESHYTEEEQRIMIKAAEDKYNSYTVEDHMDDAAMERYPGNCGRDIYIPWLNKLVTKTDLTISDSQAVYEYARSNK